MIYERKIKNFLRKFGIKELLRRVGLVATDRRFIFSIVPEGGRCAEIGVWRGDFSREIHYENSPDELILIDPWEFQPDFENRMYGGSVAKSQKDMDQMYEGVKNSFKKHENVTIYRDYSEQAANNIEDNSLDWVYIDGNHYYEYVKKDLKIFSNKVNPGGFIVGDDYDWTPKPGGDQEVKRAVDEVVEKSDDIKLVIIKNNQYILRLLES
jgi:hypothetical protein